MSEMVREAIDDWIAFFNKYNYQNLYFGTDSTLRYFKDLKPKRMAFDFKEKAECDAPADQVRVLFSDRAPIDPVWESPSGGALGAAIRGPYNHETFRTGGTIWIKNRKNPARRAPLRAFKHLLLHELGHLFGRKHDEVFVVAEDAAVTSMEVNGIVDAAFHIDTGKIEVEGWPFRLQPGTSYPLPYRGVQQAAWYELVKAAGAKGDLWGDELRYDSADYNGQRMTLVIKS